MTIVAGTKLGRYEIRSQIGAGGMGEVYLAYDATLDRSVAVKVLPTDVALDNQRLFRFLQEARAASKLKSSYIAHVYEIGEEDQFHFIAMEYVEGEPLSDRIRGALLLIKDVVTLGIQIADALDEVHNQGITHRDIKPSNIILTPKGNAKLLDFGLAKFDQVVPENLNDATTQLKTSPGIILGTVIYMSPEQALGQTVDLRSDIFSLGAVLYEMTTGRPPFTGTSTVEVIDQIVHAQPLPLSRFNYNVPKEFERIVRKCLEKDRERRYQSARELLIDLESLTRAGLGETVEIGQKTDDDTATQQQPLQLSSKAIYSIAVLPFENASSDPNADYLSDGLTEIISNNLSQLPKLKVMARSTVFRYKGQQVDPTEVGKRLGVRAVATGRVQQLNDRLMIGIELVDVSDGSLLWGERYSRQMTDIFALQEEIAEQITRNLQLRLTGSEKQQLAKHHTENSEAYQCYLKGRYFWNKRTEEDANRGIEYFQQALTLDRNFALAYVGIADCRTLLGDVGVQAMLPKDAFLEGQLYAARALQLDDSLAEAHGTMGHISMHLFEWTQARNALQRALELNPNNAQVYLWYAYFKGFMGQFDEAIATARQAMQIDPLSQPVSRSTAELLYFAGRFEEAVAQFDKSIEMEPHPLAHVELGRVYEHLKMFEAAESEFARACELSCDSPESLASLAHCYAVSGAQPKAEELLEKLIDLSTQRYVSPYDLALINKSLGRTEACVNWLNRAYQIHDGWMIYITVDRRWERLRGNKDFDAIVSRVGLPAFKPNQFGANNSQ